MGTINHGTQTVSHKYYEEVTANNRNVRLVNIIPRGIYLGGYLEKIDDTEIRMTVSTVEIGDNDVQVRVETSAEVLINNSTLESGSLSITTPYIVLRWVYVASQNNYMEIHAVASVSAAQANDIIVGKVVFTGLTITDFSYDERTFLTVQDLFLKPRQIGSGTTMYIGLRAGRVHTNTGYVIVPECWVGPFVAPASPESRIDLVYIDDAGEPQMLQGTPAVSPTAPSYDGRLVVSEVTIVNDDTGIVASRIRDVRSFLTPRAGVQSIPNGMVTVAKMHKYDSGWFAITKNQLYTKVHGLGAEPIIVMCYIAENSDGSGRRASANGSNDRGIVGVGEIVDQSSGTTICTINSANIAIRTGKTACALATDLVGAYWNPVSAYARIIAIQ